MRDNKKFAEEFVESLKDPKILELYRKDLYFKIVLHTRNIEEIKATVEECPEVLNYSYPQHPSHLFQLVLNKDLEIIKACFESINEDDRKKIFEKLNIIGMNLLHVAVTVDDNEELVKFLASNFPIFLRQYPDNEHMDLTPVYISVSNVKNLKALYEACKEIGEEKVFFEIIKQPGTPFHHAVLDGYTESAEFLVKTLEIDPNTLDSHGNHPLILAVLTGNLEMVKMLINSGADFSKLSIESSPAISLPSESQIIVSAIEHGKIDLFKEIYFWYKKSGKEFLFNAVIDGKFPLQIAADSQEVEIVDFLLNIAKVSLDNMRLTEDQKVIILSIMIMNKDLDSLGTFIDSQEIDLNHIIEGHQISLLNLAMNQRWEEGVEVLLNNGADVNCLDSNGISSMSFAIMYGGVKKIIEMCTEKASNKTLSTTYTLFVSDKTPESLFALACGDRFEEISSQPNPEIPQEFSDLLDNLRELDYLLGKLEYSDSPE